MVTTNRWIGRNFPSRARDNPDVRPVNAPALESAALYRERGTTLPIPQVPGRQSVYGHRGAQALEVENTAAALHAGFQKADGVEIDVQLTRDGQLVIFHDDTTGRLTGPAKDWAIQDKTLAELKTLDLGGGQRILTLDEALEIFEQYPGKALNIEIKTAAQSQLDSGRRSDVADPASLELGRRVAVALRGQSANWNRLVVSSFDPAGIEGFRSVNTTIPCALLYDHPSAPFYGDTFSNVPGELGFVARKAKEIGAQAVNPNHKLIDATSLASLAREGIDPATVATYTVPSAEEARRLASLGVGTIIVNDPGMTSHLPLGPQRADALWR